MIKISPSILSCDYSRMGEELENMRVCGADWLHIDVMDGHFVPNITLGAPLIKCLRGRSPLVFDVHLMISDPMKYATDFVKAGADILTFHVESGGDTAGTLALIRELGCKCALSVKPATPAEVLFPYLDSIDMALVMTVEPGFGGQSFMEDMLRKVSALRQECVRRGILIDIQVDGGISRETVGRAAAAGANVFVAGNAVFGADDPKGAISELRALAAQAYKGV